MNRLGQYEIFDELDRENGAVLYRARDSKSKRDIALWVLQDTEMTGPETIEHFVEAATIIAKIQHPYIVPVYDYGNEDGTPFIAMRLTQGKTLRNLLAENERLSFEQALPILFQIAEALDYVWEQGLVYQTLDPSNVVLEGKNGSPMVTLTNFNPDIGKRNGTEQKGDSHVSIVAGLAFEMLIGRQPNEGELSKYQSSNSVNDFIQSTPVLSADETEVIESVLPILATDDYSNAGELISSLLSVNDSQLEQTQQVGDVMQVLALVQSVRTVEDWLEVQALALEIAKDDETQRELLSMIAEAAAASYRKDKIEAECLQLESLYNAGEQALAEKEWERALAAFEKVAKTDPEYREIQDKLAQTTTELQRAQLYNQAMTFHESGDLVQACYYWLALLRDKWNYQRGSAVREFANTVEALLDQLVQNRLEQQESLAKPGESLSRFTDLFLMMDQKPYESGENADWLDNVQLENPAVMEGSSKGSLLTTDWLNKLALKMTERLNTLPAEHLEAQDQDLNDQAQNDPWLERLSLKMTEQLDGTPEEGMVELDENSQNLEPSADAIDELIYRQTERLQYPPSSKIGSSSGYTEEKIRPDRWSDTMATKKTERLVAYPGIKHAREKSAPHDDNQMIKAPGGKEMVFIPSGEFIFGVSSLSISLDEFWMDKTPVTNAEYKRFLDAVPKHPVPYSDLKEAKPYNWDNETRTYPNGMANHPVVLVSYFDAQAYASWAGKRLPSEKEWEKAARGVDGRIYPWGRVWLTSACNTAEMNSGSTTPVGQFSPAGDSPYGCVDMSGNVWEWTASEFSIRTMVVRGGSWRNGQLDAWCTMRTGHVPSTFTNYIGFRLVLTKDMLE